MINQIKIGEKIASQRKLNNIKQSELADKLFVTHQAVSKWENGKSIPSIEIMVELTKLFNITIDFLLDDSEVDNNDFKSLLNNYSRETAFNIFLKNDSINKLIGNSLYLFTKVERANLVDQIISGKSKINIEILWPYLNKDERNYLLIIIINDKFTFDLRLISQSLTKEERYLLSANNKLRYTKHGYDTDNFKNLKEWLDEKKQKFLLL